MAQRKKPQVTPVKDSSVADNTILETFMLQPSDFNRYVKFCFQGRTDSVKQLKEESERQLERVGVKLNSSKAVPKCPEEASNNVNLQSLYAWMNKLDKGHKRAVAQLNALCATACRRLGV